MAVDLFYTKTAFELFSGDVIKFARKRLTETDKNVSRNLYDSLKYNLKVSPNSFQLDISMLYYGTFQDKGVSGTHLKRPGTTYTYRQSSAVLGLEYNQGVFQAWLRARKIRFRDAQGRFLTYKQSGFILAVHIKKKGFKGTQFFTKSFEQTFKRLPSYIDQKFKLDLDKFLAYSSRHILSTKF